MGKRRASPRPRRAPDRKASRAIVESILQASALLLERDGVEALNTNAVARVAGVSVGSLYQYFPDKRAIVAELARSLVTNGLGLASMQLAPPPGGDLRAATWHFVQLTAHPSFGAAPLRRTLLREVPRSWIAEALDQVDSMVQAMLASGIASLGAELRPGDPTRRAFVTMQAPIAAVNGAFLLEPGWPGTPAFNRELFHLVWRYHAPEGADLSPPADPPRPELARPAPADDAALRARVANEPSRRLAIASRTARGGATRQALVAATREILATEGYAALSVRRIASAANVTGAAVYRHFPNLESIVAEIRFEHEVSNRRLVAAAVDRMRGLDGRTATRELVSVFVSPELGSLRLRRALLSEVPRRWVEEATLETQHLGRLKIAEMFDSRGAEIRPGDREMMAFVACRAVEGVIETAIRRSFGEAELGALVDELTEMLWRYVRA